MDPRLRRSAPPHVRARAEDIAPFAFLVGDPARAERLAAKFKDPYCYNRHRGLVGFTGEYEGVRLSVQTTSMGSPSAAIVVEELADLGVRTVVRLGTCGAIAPSVDVLDIVIATAASPLEGTTRQYVAGIPFAPAADFAVVSSLVRAAAGKRPFHVGGIVTQDAFYLEDAALNSWQALGVLATEMETSAIFTVSALRGMRAGSACLVVDRVSDPSSWVSESEQDVGIEDLMRIGLEAALALQGGA